MNGRIEFIVSNEGDRGTIELLVVSELRGSEHGLVERDFVGMNED